MPSPLFKAQWASERDSEWVNRRQSSQVYGPRGAVEPLTPETPIDISHTPTTSIISLSISPSISPAQPLNLPNHSSAWTEPPFLLSHGATLHIELRIDTANVTTPHQKSWTQTRQAFLIFNISLFFFKTTYFQLYQNNSIRTQECETKKCTTIKCMTYFLVHTNEYPIYFLHSVSAFRSQM